MGCPEQPEPIKKPKNLLGLRAGPRDKSKKGTVTGTVRFKLTRDPKTGEFKQIRDDEDGNNSTSRKFSVSTTKKEEDGEFTIDGVDEERRQQPEDQKVVEEDEEDLFAELEEHERNKKLEERRLIEKQQRDKKEEEERELETWEKQVWSERWRAENTPGFKEWEAVCIDLEDWKRFVTKFENSQDQDEQDLRQYALDWIPEYEKLLAVGSFPLSLLPSFSRFINQSRRLFFRFSHRNELQLKLKKNKLLLLDVRLLEVLVIRLWTP
jgi:hypothetical protein